MPPAVGSRHGSRVLAGRGADCRLPLSRHSDRSVNSISARWNVFEQLAAIKLNRAPSDYAWAAVANSSIDARDYLAGGDFSGVETVTSAFWAHLAVHPTAVAENRISTAIEAWSTRFHSSTRGAAA